MTTKLFDLAATAVWALDEAWLKLILDVASGQGEGPEAVSARLGRPLVNARSVEVRDGVAVIPIQGPIFRRGNMLSEVSATTSTEVVARDLRVALDSPDVRAILLNVDSPGGEVNGVNELANMIFAARESGKPIKAYVSQMGTSGAYWLAAATHEIVVDATAQLGSIGVRTVLQATKAQAGVYEFVSSQSPRKVVDPSTEQGRAEIQERVDALASVFVASVARFRGVDEQRVIRDFGAGGVKVGAHAVAAGLADREGSFESIIAELADQTQSSGGRIRMAANNPETTKTFAIAALTAAFVLEHAPDVAKELRAAGAADATGEHAKALDEARTSAAKAERERILGIEANAIPGHEKLVAELKADGVTTPDQAAARILQAERAKGPAYLGARQREDVALGKAAAGGTATGDDPAATGTLEERAKAAWAADEKLQAEFGTIERFLAFRKREARGEIRLLRRTSAA